MRKLLILICVLGITHFSFAQNPVKWQFYTKKIKDNTYEIHVAATIEEPWSIYSQSTPDGGPMPTKIVFAKNPLIDPSGKLKEVGSLKKKFEDVFDVDVLYYKNKVDFVQVVTLKIMSKLTLQVVLNSWFVIMKNACHPIQ